MTPMIARALPVVAMAAPADSNVSPWVQFLPFALALAIVYFVLLLPMKRRQKKLQSFLDSLKVGDRVITTGGIYGKITGVTDTVITLEIAPNVRIKVSKSSIAGAASAEAKPADEKSK